MSDWIECPAEGDDVVPVRGFDGEIIGRVARYRVLDDGTIETQMSIEPDFMEYGLQSPLTEVTVGPFGGPAGGFGG